MMTCHDADLYPETWRSETSLTEDWTPGTSSLQTIPNQIAPPSTWPIENELRMFVDTCLAHYDHLINLEAMVAKNDVFHLISGAWKTPTERCFLCLEVSAHLRSLR
ncbi:hypothetical protein Bca4012_000283 [Brassica carinata]